MLVYWKLDWLLGELQDRRWVLFAAGAVLVQEASVSEGRKVVWFAKCIEVLSVQVMYERPTLWKVVNVEEWLVWSHWAYLSKP